MRKKTEIEEKLIKIVEPVLNRMNLELVDLELKREAGGRVFRVFIDSPEGVTLDTCSDANNALSAVLDETDPIEGPYTLEVSSPGIERPLTKAEDFVRFVGERIRVKTYEPVDGRRDFTGTLVGADDRSLTIEVEGAQYEIEFSKVSKANLKPMLNF